MPDTVASGTAITETSLDADYLNLARPATSSFNYLKDDPGESILVNVVGGLDQPEQIRYSVTSVPDIFKASPVNPIAGQRPDGISVLVQLTQVLKVTPETEGAPVRYLPVSAHMVLKLPIDPDIDSGVITNLVSQLVGSVCRNQMETLGEAYLPLLHGVTRLPDPVVQVGL